jgi:imidazole glycerol phosphate synthase subunit HisF
MAFGDCTWSTSTPRPAEDRTAEIVADLLRDTSVPLQIGGGVRSETQIEELLASGATAVVVGTRALEDSDWLRARHDDVPERDCGCGRRARPTRRDPRLGAHVTA